MHLVNLGQQILTFIHQFPELILLWFTFQDNFLYLVLLHFLLIELHPSIEIHYADPDVVLKGYELLDKIVDIQIFLYIVFLVPYYRTAQLS